MDTTTKNKSDHLFDRARGQIGGSDEEMLALGIIANSQAAFEAERENILRLAAKLAKEAGQVADAVRNGHGLWTDFQSSTSRQLSEAMVDDRGNVSRLLGEVRVARALGVDISDEEVC